MPIDGPYQDFARSILQPASEILNGCSLLGWAEDRADELASFGRRVFYIELSGPYLSALGIEKFTRTWNEATRGPVASISLSPSGHKLRLARARQLENDRALIAHELGHALLYSNGDIWRLLSHRGLSSDPYVERLADDIGRILLMPRSLLRDLVPPTLGQSPYSSTLGAIMRYAHTASTSAKVPLRIAFSRFLQAFSTKPASLVCIASKFANKGQLELFRYGAERKSHSSRRTPDNADTATVVRWIVHFKPHNELGAHLNYPFVDGVRIYRTKQISADEASLIHQCPSCDVPLKILERILEPSHWSTLRHYRTVSKVAVSRAESAMVSAFLFE
jgi:hypothetical protein